jgi:hypothetical protein
LLLLLLLLLLLPPVAAASYCYMMLLGVAVPAACDCPRLLPLTSSLPLLLLLLLRGSWVVDRAPLPGRLWTR